ncbi:MAG: hypothetical protein R3C68_19490, partial [Myxococcota bacterium]
MGKTAATWTQEIKQARLAAEEAMTALRDGRQSDPQTFVTAMHAYVEMLGQLGTESRADSDIYRLKQQAVQEFGKHAKKGSARRAVRRSSEVVAGLRSEAEQQQGIREQARAELGALVEGLLLFDPQYAHLGFPTLVDQSRDWEHISAQADALPQQAQEMGHVLGRIAQAFEVDRGHPALIITLQQQRRAAEDAGGSAQSRLEEAQGIFQTRQEDIDARLSSAAAVLDSANQSLAAASSDVSDARVSVSAQRDRVQSLESNITQMAVGAQALERERYEIGNTLDSLGRDVDHLERRRSRLREKISHLEGQLRGLSAAAIPLSDAKPVMFAAAQKVAASPYLVLVARRDGGRGQRGRGGRRSDGARETPSNHKPGQADKPATPPKGEAPKPAESAPPVDQAAQ